MPLRVRSLLLLLTLLFAAAVHAEKPKLITRTFKVPSDFLSCEMPSANAPAAPADPFAAGAAPATTPAPNTTPPPRPNTAKQTLEAQGITFPEGAGASFDPVTGLLTITNTSANLDLTEAFVETMRLQAPANVAFTLTVIEGPGELIREADALASRSANAAPALSKLLDHAKKPGSGVHVVGDAFLETKSGTRATTEAVCEHSQVTEFNLDAKSRASIAKEPRPVGLRLEIEPTVGADSSTIEITLSLTLNAAPPVQRQVSVNDPLTGNAAEFPVTDTPGSQITTGISMTAGSTKLLSVTKPAGTPQENADVLRAAFLTTTLRRVELLPEARPKAVAPAALPAGMTFTALYAPEGLFTAELQVTPHTTLQAWFAQAGITFPAGAITEHRGDVLHLVNTPDNITLIAAIVDQLLGMSPKTIAFTAHTVEAPAAFLRDLARQTLASADDSAMFAAVEAAITRGEARFINSSFFEDKSGNRATHQTGFEHRYLDAFGTDAKGNPDLSFETRFIGSILEVEPTIGADNRTVELTFNHELHPSSPVIRRDHFRDPASQKNFEMPVTDFHAHKTTTSISLTNGSTKLISLNAPASHEGTGKLWATFLKCDVVPQFARTKIRTRDFHAPAKSNLPDDSNEMYVRQYRLPPDILSDRSADLSLQTHSSDLTPRRPTDVVLKEFFETQGVNFPKGASVRARNDVSGIIARNTSSNLDLIEAVVKRLLADSNKSTAFTTHVLQASGPLLRRLAAQAATKSNHRAELDELLAAVKTGAVRHLDTARIETKSGTRATTEQGIEHIAITEVSVNEKGEPVFGQEARKNGLRIELEPTVGADGVTVELNIAPEFHTAAPFEHREHVIDTQGRKLEFPLTDYHFAKVTTALTLPDGTARLLSLYKPTGRPEFEKEDVLQAIFITCDLLRVGE